MITDEKAKSLTVASLDRVDWSRHSICLGAHIDGRRDWMELDRDDLRILHELLTRRVTAGAPAAAEISEPLSRLAEWAAAVALWQSRR